VNGGLPPGSICIVPIPNNAVEADETVETDAIDV
jgi:hypothetical protein